MNGSEVFLDVVLALAGLGSAGIIGLALAALVQRRTWPYLLVTLALATLLARTALGTASVMGTLPVGTHHTLEHVLDVLMAGLVIAAVYTARSAREITDPSEPSDPSKRSEPSERSVPTAPEDDD